MSCRNFHQSLSREDRCFLRVFKVAGSKEKDEVTKQRTEVIYKKETPPQSPVFKNHFMQYMEAIHEMYIDVFTGENSMSDEEMSKKVKELKGLLKGMLVTAGDSFDVDPEEIRTKVDNLNATIDRMATEPMDDDMVREAAEEFQKKREHYKKNEYSRKRLMTRKKK